MWELRFGIGGVVAFGLWFLAVVSNPFGWDPVLWFAAVSFAPAVPLLAWIGWGMLEHRQRGKRLMRQEFIESEPARSSTAHLPRAAKPH